MTATRWARLPAGAHDIRLVVSDMDGTLLTPDGGVPESFWPLLEVMHARGITFVPASGRQYATLARLFDHSSQGISYIAENGGLVVHNGETLSSAPLGTARGICAELTDSSVRLMSVRPEGQDPRNRTTKGTITP